MNISLTPELERLVTDRIETGLYETATDVVREGLHLLLERDRRAEALRRDVLAGFDAVERGEYTECAFDELASLADRVKARGRSRLAAEGIETVTR